MDRPNLRKITPLSLLAHKIESKAGVASNPLVVIPTIDCFTFLSFLELLISSPQESMNAIIEQRFKIRSAEGGETTSLILTKLAITGKERTINAKRMNSDEVSVKCSGVSFKPM